MPTKFTHFIQNPVFMRKFNGFAVFFWIIMIPISIATGWISSIVYVSALSIYALVVGHLSAYSSARVEVKQEEDADVQEVLDEVKKIKKASCEEIADS